jgi:beta-lactamase class A
MQFRNFAAYSVVIIFFIGCNNTSIKTRTALKLNPHDSLRYKIDSIAKQAKGKVGVAISFLSDGDRLEDTISYNGEMHLPMQSTYKFPLALYILHRVDSGKISLQQKIHISAKTMDQDTWSPMADSFENGGDFTVRELLRYMVSESDNIACDELFKIAGGTEKVNDYIHSLGVNDIAIKATEAQMHADWPTQYTNWCAPKAMVQLLDLYYQKKVITGDSYGLLWKYMTVSKNSPNRIAGLLLKGPVVAHKTGTGGTKDGIASATNDIGIIVIEPASESIEIAIEIVVYVSDSKADMATRERVIAEIAKAAYDSYADLVWQNYHDDNDSVQNSAQGKQ